MITYDEALKMVRKEFPNWLIRMYDVFDNEYYFHISPGSYFSVDDVAILMVIVNIETGKIRKYGTGEFVWEVLMNASDDYRKRWAESPKKCKPVDLTPEQWQEYVNYRGGTSSKERAG